MDKNQKVTLFRSIMKLVVVFLVLTVLEWQAWNQFVVEELGIGSQVGIERAWIFGFPSFAFFYIFYLLSPAWFILLKLSDFIIYSSLMFGWLGLMLWL
jgi:hypothetical protein